MNKRTVTEFVVGSTLLCSGVFGGYFLADHNRGIQGELCRAREKIGHVQCKTQGEMTISSQFQLLLAQMELYHVRYTIWNQDNYSLIEDDFQKDEQRWDEELQKEQAKPSEFEGGSMAPMDHNLRMAAFMEKRIKELKEKWCK